MARRRRPAADEDVDVVVREELLGETGEGRRRLRMQTLRKTVSLSRQRRLRLRQALRQLRAEQVPLVHPEAAHAEAQCRRLPVPAVRPPVVGSRTGLATE